MNSIYPIIEPIVEAWDYYLHDPFLKDLEQFAAMGYGTDWMSKYVLSEKNKLMKPYHALQKRFKQEPEMADLLEDNLTRLTVLYGLERHITVRQAQGALKTRFFFGENNTSVFQRMIQTGFLRNYFRGFFLNTVQFMSNMAHPLYYTRGKSYFNHFLTTSALEWIIYPLDTIKTILQADVHNKYKGALDVVSKVCGQDGIFAFYRGVMFKVAFNGVLIYHLRNIYENSSQMYLSTPLLAVSYILLTFKTRVQILNTALTSLKYHETEKVISNMVLEKGIQGLYRGLLPFMFLNTFFHWNFYALYSQQTQDRVLGEIVKNTHEKMSSPKQERIWV